MSDGGVVANSGVSSSVIVTVIKARLVIGIALLPKMGAVITNAPTRASTNVKVANWLNRSVSKYGIVLLQRTRDVGDQIC